jgi:hypothetical protein
MTYMTLSRFSHVSSNAILGPASDIAHNGNRFRDLIMESFQDKWKRDSEARLQYIPNIGRGMPARMRLRSLLMPKMAIEKLDATGTPTG